MNLKKVWPSWSVSFENIIIAWPQGDGLQAQLFLGRLRQEDCKHNASLHLEKFEDSQGNLLTYFLKIKN